MARLLVDANIRGNVLELLRDASHDVLSIYEAARGLTDEEVLELAVRESRILVTLDKTDFGALIFQGQSPHPPAVILFRMRGITLTDTPEFITRSISTRDNWEGCFWVIDGRSVRSRPFPG